MLLYEKKLPIEVQITRPNFKYYLLLDRQLQGCKAGLEQANVYIRQSFMILNEEYRTLFMRLGMRHITNMEVLAKLIHQMHGVDARYYDESNDDTPAFEFISPAEHEEETKPQKEEKHHVNNDLTAAVMRNMKFEEQQKQIYETLSNYIEDDGAYKVLQYLKKSNEDAFQMLRDLLDRLTNDAKPKDFGLGDSHNAWDLDTENYIDKLNPIFMNPSDLEDLPFKK